jgi:hypothetical protein
MSSAVRASQALAKRPGHDQLDLHTGGGRGCGLYALDRH